MSDLLKMMTRKLEQLEEAIDFLEERIQILENELDSALDNLTLLNETHGLCELNEEKHKTDGALGKFTSIGLYCPTCSKAVSGIEGEKHECIKS